VSDRIISKAAIKAGELTVVLAPVQTAGDSFFHRVWPPAVIIIGIAVTMAWTALLGYGLVRIIWSAV
jgi:hypothetical protein